MANIKQFVPEFYEQLYGKTNTVTHSAELLELVLSEISSRPMNNWDDLAVLNQEFKTDQVIVSGFKIRDTAFLKSFFKFKGTNSDLQYVLNNLGYESVIYNDGGILHLSDEPDEHGQPKYDLIDVTGYGKSTPCAIEIQINIDLNSPNYDGFSSQGFGGLKEVCEERINMCSYLDKISVSAIIVDEYPIQELEDDYASIKALPPFESEYFEEYSEPPIPYGREENNDLKYQQVGALKKRTVYGKDQIKYFRPISDELIMSENKQISEQALNINSTDIENGVPLNDYASAVKSANTNESYSVTENVTELLKVDYKSKRAVDDDCKIPESTQEEVLITKKTYHDYRTKYGKENNGALQYLKNAITKFGDLFNPPDDQSPTVEEYIWAEVSGSNKD